ncbi:MAG: NEW3 domain-containing protein [Dehalococcoidales bacterium]|nr:NEW3 domain-containing protein [Dehalococcoidales bacterium]
MSKTGLSVNFKFCYLLLAIVGLAALLSPSYALAQDGKDGLILRYVSGGYSSVVVPDESKLFFMEVANDSSNPTTNIQFTSDAPKEWVVEFKPQSIDALNAGSYQTVEISITAPQNAEKGNYLVTVIADSNIGLRVMNIYIGVEEGTNFWKWVGSVMGVLVIVVSVIIFRRFDKD